MKSDIYAVIILTQPKGLKKVLNIWEWTLEKMGHDLCDTCSPFFLLSNYYKAHNVVVKQWGCFVLLNNWAFQIKSK